LLREGIGVTDPLLVPQSSTIICFENIGYFIEHLSKYIGEAREIANVVMSALSSEPDG
jgi:hypothetical protein